MYYPHFSKVSVSYGIIKFLKNPDFINLCPTGEGASDSPILNLANNKFIGILGGADNNFKFNKGSTLSYSLTKFKEKYCGEPKNQKIKKFTLFHNVKTEIGN